MAMSDEKPVLRWAGPCCKQWITIHGEMEKAAKDLVTNFKWSEEGALREAKIWAIKNYSVKEESLVENLQIEIKRLGDTVCVLEDEACSKEEKLAAQQKQLAAQQEQLDAQQHQFEVQQQQLNALIEQNSILEIGKGFGMVW